jgi:hypothetical protein
MYEKFLQNMKKEQCNIEFNIIRFKNSIFYNVPSIIKKKIRRKASKYERY